MGAETNLDESVVVINPELEATTVPVTDRLWEKIDERFGDFAGSSLISGFSFDSDWPTWEMHPAGDEFVCLLSGRAEMVLALADGDQSIHLTKPGSFVIVPAGTWHTARIRVPSRMLFVTPGEGTQNREEPVRDV